MEIILNSSNNFRSDMIRIMIEDLRNELKTSNEKCLSENLIQGIKSKNYIPVMKRKTCGKLHGSVEWNM